jgi:acyl-CoA thioester hydrolase
VTDAKSGTADGAADRTQPAAVAAPSPLLWQGEVEPGWIDINDHVNVTGYDQLFDAAESRLLAQIGIDDESIARTGFTMFRLERLMSYERELRLGDRIETRSLVIWTDLRRIHHFHELWNLDSGCRAAFADTLGMHVDLRTRRAARFDRPEQKEALLRLVAAPPLPDGVVPRLNGRRIER